MYNTAENAWTMEISSNITQFFYTQENCGGQHDL